MGFPHAPFGDPPANCAPWQSNTTGENGTFPFIELLSRNMPSKFNGMEFDPSGVRNYNTVGSQQVSWTIDPITVITESSALNAGLYAIEGVFTGGGYRDPYLFAPAFAGLLAALDSGDENLIAAWYWEHFGGPAANLDNFMNTLGVQEAMNKAKKDRFKELAAGLKTLSPKEAKK